MHFRPLLIMLAGLVLAFVGGVLIVTQPFVEAVPSVPPEVDPKRLEAHVKHLSSDLFPRSFDRFDNIERSALYIEQAFKTMGAEVTIQEVLVDGVKYKNVVASFGPAEGPLLVVGAHYDSHGDGNAGAKFPGGYSTETHTPGADDNASGVAGLLELGRLLSQASAPRPVQLVAYTLEEPPHFRTEHMGSAWHARALKQQGRELELMLALEMIGYFSDEPGSQRYPLPLLSWLYPERGDFIALVGRLDAFAPMRKLKGVMSGATTLPVHSINAPPLLPGIDFSDHQSYWRQDMPAIMITDTAFLRNPNYHQAQDTHEKLDYRRMAQVVQGVFAVTQRP